MVTFLSGTVVCLWGNRWSPPPWPLIISRALCWSRWPKRLYWNSTLNFILGKNLSRKLEQTKKWTETPNCANHLNYIFLLYEDSVVQNHMLSKQLKNTFFRTSRFITTKAQYSYKWSRIHHQSRFPHFPNLKNQEYLRIMKA